MTGWNFCTWKIKRKRGRERERDRNDGEKRHGRVKIYQTLVKYVIMSWRDYIKKLISMSLTNIKH